MDFIYPSRVALDPITGDLVKDGEFQVYAPTDTEGTTPLAVKDLSGLPLGTVISTRFGLTQPFLVPDHPVVVLRSGEYRIPIESPTGMLAAAQESQQSAAAAQESAEHSEDVSETAAATTEVAAAAAEQAAASATASASSAAEALARVNEMTT